MPYFSPPLSLCLAVASVGVLDACTQASTPSSNSSATTSGDVDALLIALDDEYKAEATYEAVLAKFGNARPFSNIINAEIRHSKAAKAELDRLGVSYPTVNPYKGKIAAPASLLEACKIGITAEEENIALYDRILPTIKDQQVRTVLSNLQAASRDRHLPAFRRCVDRGGTMGAGRGGGMGRGGGL
jgi:rubrerythrin